MRAVACVCRCTRNGSVEPAALTIAAPVREQRRREARVADRADVRTAVGETDHGVRMREHLARRVEVAVVVVQDREVEERAAVVDEHQVVREFERVAAFALGPGRDARRRIGFVVGRVAELEDALEALQHAAAGPAVGAARGGGFEHPRPERGVTKRGHLVGERLAAISRYDRVREQRVQRALQTEQHARPRAARPGRSSVTPSALACVEQVEQRAPRPSPRTCSSENDSGRPDASAIRRKIAELAVDVAEVGDDLEHALPGRADGLGDADELVGLGRERRRRLAACSCGG